MHSPHQAHRSNVNTMPDDQPVNRSTWIKIGVLIALAGLIGGAWWQLGDMLTLDYLASKEQSLRQFQSQHPYLIYGIAFLLYVAVTGLSLPGALAMTIVYGWYFGFAPAVVLVSFASTTGASVAFLLSRYLFRDWVVARFGKRQQAFNTALAREGPFFLFTLRAVPLVPFFVINAVMGVTPIRLRTYWWVSQLGMLPGTIVYVYAGSTFPSLDELARKGVWSAFSTTQVIQIIAAFVLIGIFPFAVRGAVSLLKKRGWRRGAEGARPAEPRS